MTTLVGLRRFYDFQPHLSRNGNSSIPLDSGASTCGKGWSVIVGMRFVAVDQSVEETTPIH